MKVLIVTIHKHDDCRVFSREALSLVDAGYEVSLLSPMDEVEKNIKGVQIIPVRKFWGTGKGILTKIRYVIECYGKLFYQALIKKADILHCHEPSTLLVCLVIKLFTKKKVIYDVHEYWPEKKVLKYPKKLQKKVIYFYRFIESLSRWVDYILPVNEVLVTTYKQYNVNVMVLPNTARLPSKKDKFDDEIIKNYQDSFNLILTNGNHSRYRGTEHAVEAVGKLVKEIPTIKLLLIGRFDDENYKKLIDRLVEKYSIASNVVFIGKLPHHSIEMASYYQMADIGLIPYPNLDIYKNFPALAAKTTDYMSYGLPIVTSDALKLNTDVILKENCGRVYKAGDTEDFQQTILKLYKNKEEMRELSINSYQCAQEKYNWDISVNNLYFVYEQLSKDK